MVRKLFVFLLAFSLLSFFASGCAYYRAEREMKNAQALINDLKGQGGNNKVPYEYTSAEKFLEVSRLEFDEYDYHAAENFANLPDKLVCLKSRRNNLGRG
jgi:hypothetical protein